MHKFPRQICATEKFGVASSHSDSSTKNASVSHRDALRENVTSQSDALPENVTSQSDALRENGAPQNDFDSSAERSYDVQQCSDAGEVSFVHSKCPKLTPKLYKPVVGSYQL